jgi:hypothetical protein
VQVDPIKPILKPPGTKRLELKCDILLSTFAFKVKLRRYTLVDSDDEEGGTKTGPAAAAAAGGSSSAARTKLPPVSAPTAEKVKALQAADAAAIDVMSVKVWCCK